MKKNGFTLVELLISMAISVMLIGGMLYAFSAEFSLWKRIVAASEKQQIANMVLSRIIRDTRSADKILTASSTSALSLKVRTESIEYSLADNKIRRKKDGFSCYLTAAGDLAKLSFSYPGAKQVEIEVEDIKAKALLRN